MLAESLNVVIAGRICPPGREAGGAPEGTTREGRVGAQAAAALLYRFCASVPKYGPNIHVGIRLIL